MIVISNVNELFSGIYIAFNKDYKKVWVSNENIKAFDNRSS